MKFDLREFLNKKVMVKLFNGQLQTGVILRNPDEGLFRFQYSTVESKSDDSYGGYWEENMLMSRQYTSDGLYIRSGIENFCNHSWNIVDIQLAEEPKMTITKPEFYDKLPEGDKTLYRVAEKEVSNYWAKELSNFIDELGGDSPALWEWKGITPTPEKVVECLRDYIQYLEQSSADRELDECCEWFLQNNYRLDVRTTFRNARRPQPTPKSPALKDFETVRKHSDLLPEILDNIENALKSIPE